MKAWIRTTFLLLALALPTTALRAQEADHSAASTPGHGAAPAEPAAAGHEAGAGHDAAAGHGAKHGGEEVDVLHHIANGTSVEIPLLPFLGHVTIPDRLYQLISLSKVSVWMAIVAVLLIVVFSLARRGAGMVPTGLYNLLESMVVFVRDDIAEKNIGHHHARKFTPYLLTVFFFILTCNLLGLVPGGVTVTGNINVTAALALMTLVVVQVGGMREYGVVHHLKNLVPAGIPNWLLPIMIPVEIMGVLAKPFALCVRLFANMTAGHVIILSLLGLIFTSAVFIPVSIAFALFIFLLELLVAFLQAYIFTMLTSLFIGMSVHVSH